MNNITDAKLASVSNSTLKSNSSGLTIATDHNNVNINAKFGELVIESVLSGLDNFKL